MLCSPVLMGFLATLIAIIADNVNSSNACPVAVEKVGCFIDTLRPRPLNELLMTDRDSTDPVYSGQPINWYDFENYLKSLSCRCAKKAKARGFTHYGLQFYGECWSGPGAEARFAIYGPSKNCLMKLTIPATHCNRTSPLDCVGAPKTNYIYKIAYRDSRKAPTNGNWSPWDAWTKCSKPCGPGVKSRERTCTDPVPKNGGGKCKGPKNEQAACNLGTCPTPCRRDLDLGLVLDSSGSVGEPRYNTAKDFLLNLVANTQGSFNGTRFGIITYNQDPHLKLTFNKVSLQAFDKVTRLIRDLPYLHGGTRTDKALHMAARELYSLSGGDREGVANVLLVVTDGRTNHLSEPYANALVPLKDRNVHVIAVGIGGGVKESELLQIAMEQRNNVITVANYQDLHAKLSHIIHRVCEVGTQN